MPNLTIRQIAEEINNRASTHAIGALQEIRAELHGKQQAGQKIFSSQTIFEDEGYAFHHGGRSELQFNIGEDDDDGERIRHGVAFSLEIGRNLPSIP